MKAAKNTVTKISRMVLIVSALLLISFQSFGQRNYFGTNLINSVKERISNQEPESTMIFASIVVEEEQEVENWMTNFKDWAYHRLSNENNGVERLDNPVITMTIETSSMELFYEENVEVELWMTNSFEIESEVEVENWMSVPFEVTIDEYIEVEEWMSSPFEEFQEESVAVENWMTAPFEESYESELAVEDWMTTPFEAAYEEEYPVEDWMSNPMTWAVQ